MDNVCLIVIDPIVGEALELAAHANNLDLIRMGDPGIEIDYNQIAQRGGFVPENPEPVEYIINQVRFTQFMESWRNDIEGHTVHWTDGMRNRYDGINATVVLYKSPRRTQQRPTIRTPFNENLTFATAGDRIRIPDPVRTTVRPEDIPYIDEEDRYDEDGEPDPDGLYDEEGNYIEEWEDDTPTPTGQEFEVLYDTLRIPDHEYNQELVRLRERTMTLTENDISFESPLNGLHWRNSQLIALLLDNFSALNRKIVVKAPAGTPYLEMTPTRNTLHLLLYSVPILGATRTVSGDVLPRILDPITRRQAGTNEHAISTASVFAPVDMPMYNERFDIIDPTTGTVLAQLFNQKYLYVLFSATTTGSQREQTVLKYIITAALASMSSLPSAVRNQFEINLQETKTRLEEAAQEKLRIALNRLFTNQFRTKKQDLEHDINALDENIERRLRLISDGYKRISIARSELEALNAAIEKADASLDVDEFFKHPKIANIRPAGNNIILQTTHLFFTIPDNQLVFDLGEMDINIELEGSALPYIHNKTRTIHGLEDGMHHPHVFPRGNPCWGNVSQTLQKLFNTGEIKSYIDVIIAYCESVNLRDAAGEKAYRWPLAEAKHQTRENYLDIYYDATANIHPTGDVL